MAALPRCLCLILTLWMVSLRPAATLRTGSNDASLEWRTKEIPRISSAAQQYRVAGNFAAAEALYQQGYQQAQLHHDGATTVLYLTAVATCRMMQFHYRAALEAYLQAKQLAKAVGDRLNLGAILSNLSALYQQVGDIDSALRAGEEARAEIATLPPPYYKPQLLLQLGRLRMDPGDDSAGPLLEAAVEAARAKGYGCWRPGPGICWASKGCTIRSGAAQNGLSMKHFDCECCSIRRSADFPMGIWGL